MIEHYYCFDKHTVRKGVLTKDFLEDIGSFRLTPLREMSNEVIQDFTMQERTIVELSGLFFELH